VKSSSTCFNEKKAGNSFKAKLAYFRYVKQPGSDGIKNSIVHTSICDVTKSVKQLSCMWPCYMVE